MTFKEALQSLMEEIGCSGNELAASSGISAPVISRFRSGKTEPVPGSETWDKLLKGLEILAEKKGMPDPKQIGKALRDAQPGEMAEKVDRKLFSERLNTLLQMFSVGNNELARYLNYDASYISRIRSGQRVPRDMDSFAERVGFYIAKSCRSEADYRILRELTGESLEKKNGMDACRNAVRKYLFSSGDSPTDTGSIGSFLRRMDSFDLEEYIRIVRFDEVSFPETGERPPVSRFFTRLEQMMEAQLLFLSQTIASGGGSVTMYSDLPIEEMSRDPVFAKKWMLGMALMLKNGFRLRMIHNVDRPFREMMLGLESYIPLYMTGQIDPFYLPGVKEGPFRHMLWVSGAAALAGGCVSGHVKDGKLYLTTRSGEVAQYSRMAEQLAAKASPLMEIYGQDRQDEYSAFLKKESRAEGSRRSVLSALPLHTISDELALRILRRSGVPDDRQNRVLEHVYEARARIERTLLHSAVTEEIPVITEAEFDRYPMGMSLADMLYPEDILLTYQEYREHLELCGRFEKEHPGYTCIHNENPPFRNIRIEVRGNERVLVSRAKAPAIHFVIRHPGMCRAVEEMVLPFVEQV